MFEESEEDAVLSLLLLKNVEYSNTNDVRSGYSESTSTACKNGKTFNAKSEQQNYTGAKNLLNNRMIQQNLASKWNIFHSYIWFVDFCMIITNEDFNDINYVVKVKKL